MRSLRLILTASGFLTIFAGIFILSVLGTGVLHSAVSQRALPSAVVIPQ
jgi:hypothetical protein